MDKETLSNYGWIVICVLVLAVMLALATPFGKFISNAIENTTTALFQTSKAGLGSAGIDAGELVFGKQDGGAENPDTPDVPDTPVNKLIPTGGTYTVSADNTVLEGNGVNEFPETPADGDEYEEGDYTYKYNHYYYSNYWFPVTSQNGWGVRVKDNSKTSYGDILSEIAGQPVNTMDYTFEDCTSLTTAPTIPNSVTSMEGTFMGCSSLETVQIIPNSVTDMTNTFEKCTSLTTAPAIPNSVTNMDSTFQNCTSLTTAPTIPSSVTNMEDTFYYCVSLTGTIEINANPTSYDNCFCFTVEPITLRGSSPILAELAYTANRINVTVGQ